MLNSYRQMSTKIRRILFIIAIAMFLAIGFVLIIYAQGYRWDSKSNKFVLTGAIHIKPMSPKETEISINNDISDNKSEVLVKNLLPSRKYQVKVSKNEYKTWEKEFEVTPGFVVSAENIILFPESLRTQIMIPDTLAIDFNISPNQKLMAVIYEKPSKILVNNYSGGSATSTQINFQDKKKTISFGLPKNNSGWSQNSKKLIFWREIASTGKQTVSPIINWYIWDSENGTLVDLTNLYEKKILLKQENSTSLPAKLIPNKITWFTNDNNILALIGGNIFEIDIKNETIKDLGMSDVLDFDYFENKIVILKSPDILMMMESAVQNVSAIGQTKFQAEKILFSPDGNKIAYANSNTIGVLWLKDTNKQPFKKTNDQEIIYNGSSNISRIYWHKYGEHIIFIENKKLNVVELDKRGKMNIASWNDEASIINYLQKDSKLFILGNGSIKSVDGEF